MDYNALFGEIRRKKSFLCVGLDSDTELIPAHLHNYDEPVFEFNRQIIDATHEYAVAYKPNLAFYEALGAEGWIQLEKSVRYIRECDPGIFIIADAKRGDIGNTAKLYARAFFEKGLFDAITISPYMGRDSVEPFLSYNGKWAVILALTSNESASDFETLNTVNGKELYREVIEKASGWGNLNNIMFVVGATRPEKIAEIRQFCPDHFFLVPGVGAQGGSVKEVAENGLNRTCGLLVNISRSIIFASKDESFADRAKEKAAEAAAEMSEILKTAGLLG
jgi:orotidine-5'-phosphate decarboxylase